MWRFAFVFIPLAAWCNGATAPESIAGKIYRESGYFHHFSWHATIWFQTESRYTFIVWQRNLNPNNTENPVLQAAPADGSYSYRRLGDSDAEIVLQPDEGVLDPLDRVAINRRAVTFITPSSGEGTAPSDQTTKFFLSDGPLEGTNPGRNVSMRTRVSPGQPAIVGFVVPDFPQPKTSGYRREGLRLQSLLIRAIGPSLSTFGVRSVWIDPDFRLYQGDRPLAGIVESNGDWDRKRPLVLTRAYRKLFSFVGAFDIPSGSTDAAAFQRLFPGTYTVVLEPAAGEEGGEVLVEVYFMP